MSSEAFLYLWYDAPNKKYYLGKHKGSPDDSYTHSSTVWESFTKSTIPDGVRRRILAYGTDEEMFDLEAKLLTTRKERCWDRYYNVSWGGKYRGKYDTTDERILKNREEHTKYIRKRRMLKQLGLSTFDSGYSKFLYRRIIEGSIEKNLYHKNKTLSVTQTVYEWRRTFRLEDDTLNRYANFKQRVIMPTFQDIKQLIGIDLELTEIKGRNTDSLRKVHDISDDDEFLTKHCNIWYNKYKSHRRITHLKISWVANNKFLEDLENYATLKGIKKCSKENQHACPIDTFRRNVYLTIVGLQRNDYV